MSEKSRGSSLAGVSVLVVDDHAVFAEALAAALTTRAGASEVRVAETLAQGIEEIVHSQPDLVVLDVRIDRDNGLVILDELATLSPDSRAVVLTGHPRPDVHRRAAAHGATVVAKGSGLDELIAHLVATVRGGEDVQPAIPSAACALSTREAQVLQLLAAGNDVSQVARRLGLSSHTVRDHVRSARTKFGVPSQLAAVMEAMRQGEIEFPT